MTYKKDDILIFLTNEPMLQACEMNGEPMEENEIEKVEYYGFVKSVISHKDGLYLMQTIKPLREFICVAKTSDIIRKVDKNELPEDKRERPRREWKEAPNVYIPTQNEVYESLTDEDRCFALAIDALNALCSDMELISLELNADMYSKCSRIDAMDFFDEEIEKIKDSAKKEELLNLKKEITEYILSRRFKEYFSLTVTTNTPCENDFEDNALSELEEDSNPIETSPSYFDVLVSKEFDEVCILYNGAERGQFFRSLGHEYVDMENAFVYYESKVCDLVD